MQTLREIKSELVRLKWHVAAMRLERAMQRRALAWKSSFNPSQPRVPAGQSNGGQWTSGSTGRVSIRIPLAAGDGTGFGLSDEEGSFEDFYGYEEFIDFGELDTFDGSDPTDFSDARRRPPLPPIENPSGIPSIRPDNTQHINQVAREVARNPYLTAYYFVTIAESVGHWLNEKSAEIKANQDPPKSLEELHDAVFRSDKNGYDDHHIVERWTARDGRFSGARVYNNENVVSIPRYKHEEINSWYQTPNAEYGGVTPRQYLQSKGWDEHRRIGLDALRKFGILKP